MVDYEEIDGEHLKATLHLFGDEGNPIGTKILDFANPTTYSTLFGGGPKTFVPADGTSEESRTLLPNTSYVISFRLPNPRTLRWFTVDATESDSETQRSNWSIANKSYWKRAGWGWSTRRDSMKMKVLGTLVRPTASFSAVPDSHDGEDTAFTVELRFSEDLPLTSAVLRGALTVTGGAVTAAEKAGEADERTWRIAVQPSSQAGVTIALATTENCGDAGAICTGDGRPLSVGARAEVRGPMGTPEITGVAQVGDTLEATFAEVPIGTLTWQWMRGSKNIAGAEASTYTLTEEDVGVRFSVRVERGGESVVSAPTGPVWPAPANTPLADGEEELLLATVTLESYKSGVRSAGYGRIRDQSFGAMDNTSFEDGGTTYAVEQLFVIADGYFTIVTDSRLPTPEGLVAYWNGYRITGLARTGGGGLLVGRLPQPETEYLRYWDGASDGVRVAVSLRRVRAAAEAEAVQLEPNSVTAEFLNWPAEHNRREFTFKIRFSKGFSLSYLTLRDHALSVTNGALNDVSRVNRQGEEKDWEWNVTVTPDGSENVTVTLAATTDCTAAGAICTADGWPLSPAVTVVVPETAASFTVKFEDDHTPPDTHDGTTPIVFRIAFSKESRGYSYKTLRDHTLSIWQGQSLNATAVRRLEQGSNKRWEVTIDPVSRDDLTVGIGPTSSCNDAGAVCAEGGQMLANSIRKVIKGPPGISVADARVEEAADATVDFMVSLNRESTSTVTVDYATSDATAIAGEDYTQTSGTLTFAAGETEKTVSVAVLDDGHDEGEETFTLTLSNPSGGNAWLKDATATGTIKNTDAMPRAWLARFGRTVAEHVIEGVRSRLSGSRSPGVRTEFADYEPLREGDEQILKHDDNLAFYEWVSGESWRRTELRELSGRDILDVGAFSVTSGESSSGFLSLWGRAALSRFDGRDADVTVDGEVRTFSLGADWSSGPLTAGLSLSRSGGDGGWTFEGEGGSVESSLTGVYPYVGYELTDRLSVWGVGGYARGEIELRMPGGTETVRADADMSMAAVGARGDIVSGAAGTLALEADALFARTGSEAAEGIVAASEADVSRLRLALTGSYSRSLGETLLTPSLEAGVRRDGGDAETGFGVDLGGGISVSSPARGLSLELKVRGLLAHESGGFEQWGTSVSVLWDPDPSTERGMRIFLGRTLGAESSGGAEALFRRVTLEELGREGGSGGSGQFEAEASYGLGAFGGRGTFSPYVGLASRDAPGREWRGGGRLRLGSVEGALTGTLSEGGGYGREAGVSLSVRIPLGGAGAVESSFVNGSLYSE